MRIQRSFIIPIVISLVFFFLPFFWLNPGEMDLGGDNTRLYFYDPLNYMLSQTLYSVVGSGIGGVAFSYYSIPYILFLKTLKSLIDSSTILISIMNGLNLSVAFISIYFIVKELSQTQKNYHASAKLEISAILAGFFYIFSPYLINGWNRTLLTHNQFFLNPLMFFLFLRYCTTRNIKYLLVVLIITFIFSINFSYLASPAIFAFYPFSLLFIALHTKYVRKTPVPIKGLLIGFLVFLMLQLFHIVPHVLNTLVPGSQIDVFSEWSKFTRGQNYFTAIASSIKVSISWMNLSQGGKIDILSYGFIVFPFIIIAGFLLGRSKHLFLTGIFFLATLFFATANITYLGFLFYKSLFYIPTFSMFRNFYGQWGFVFCFFYTILFGQSLAVIFNKVGKKVKYVLVIYIIVLFVFNSWSFINGSVIRADLFQTDHVSSVIKMDPEYEKVLSFVRNLPIDGKILSFPFPDPGYQIISGKDGGAYIGPSTFSYLAGKNDFTGYDGITPFQNHFFKFIEDNDYDSLEKLFSILNIRYIFYNSDPRIFDGSFPGFPYSFVRDYFPTDQKSYKKFIKQLPIYRNKSFGDNYHLFNVRDDFYLPHIFVSSENVYTNKPMDFPFYSFNYATRSATFSINDIKNNKGTVILEAKNNSPLFELYNNYHLHQHQPYVSRSPDSFWYVPSLLKEQSDLIEAKRNNNLFLDTSLLLLTKRIFELDRFGDTMSVTRVDWTEPKIWEFYKWKDYNTWEAGMKRYEDGMEKLIQWVVSNSQSDIIGETNKIKINEQLSQHRDILIKKIKDGPRKDKEKQYLSSLVNAAFSTLSKSLVLRNYDSSINATLQIPKDKLGEYDIYLEKTDKKSSSLSQAYIVVDGKVIRPTDINYDANFMKFDKVDLKQDKVDIVVFIPDENLIKDLNWQNQGNVNMVEGVVEFNFQNDIKGLNKKIIGWRPNKQFLISFDYLTHGDEMYFTLYDKKSTKSGGVSVESNQILRKAFSSDIWQKQQSIITSGADSVEAYILLSGAFRKKSTNFKIRNFSIVEIDNPMILFKKLGSTLYDASKLPVVTFTKINPTKYIIRVSNAKDSYTLIFLEEFNSNWKLVDRDRNSNRFKSNIARFLGEIGEKVTSIFIKNRPGDINITARYFNGEIKEGGHANIFLEPNTFETWGKDSIASYNHIPIYGYANAWNITPSDMNGRTDYTLILEKSTQKHFYMLFFISLSTFFSLVVYLLLKIFKKWEK